MDFNSPESPKKELLMTIQSKIDKMQKDFEKYQSMNTNKQQEEEKDDSDDEFINSLTTGELIKLIKTSPEFFRKPEKVEKKQIDPKKNYRHLTGKVEFLKGESNDDIGI